MAWITLTALACQNVDEGAGRAARGDAALATPLPQHVGPPVSSPLVEGDTARRGPARFLATLAERYRAERAMETVAFCDGFFRAPANDGYEAVLAHLDRRLRAAGFEARDGLSLDWLVLDPAARAWTPLSASVALEHGNGDRTVLHAFDQSGDPDRIMLPTRAPSCDVSGWAAFSLAEVEQGSILVTETRPRADVLRRAESHGAVAVLSASLAGYNLDPTTREPLQHALQFRGYPRSGPTGSDRLPLAQISRASLEAIRAEHEATGSARVTLRATVKEEVRPHRALVATVRGATEPDEAVVIATYIDYAGASDNASGTGALLEGAVAFADALAAGASSSPARSLVFLWGTPILQSERWLETTQLTPIASIVLSAAGDSATHHGSPQLLERMPDPGVLLTLPPDEHTHWGVGDFDSEFTPNGVALIARCALADVSQSARGWRTQEHPWEGGLDHDVFIEAGIPATLLWHFTSPWYHTSLDRLDKVDPEELRRSGLAALSTALALADPSQEDIRRYLSSLELERELRVGAARAAGEQENAAAWSYWCDGSRDWLQGLLRD